MKKILLLLLACAVKTLCVNDGAFDPTFNGGTIVTTGAPSGFVSPLPTAYAVAVQTDGKIVTAGQDVNGNFQTIRYNTNGSLDTSFNGGIVTLGIGLANGIALQPDGKIIVVGTDGPATLSAVMPTRGLKPKATADPNFAVVRYLANGQLDTSFGNGGIINNMQGSANSAALQTDGKIVVAGTLVDNLGNSSYNIVRYLPNGTIDTTFGGGTGIATAGTPLSNAIGSPPPAALSVQIQSDGNIITSGGIFNGALFFYATARFTTLGALDTSWGGTGIVTVGTGIVPNPAIFPPYAWSLVIQPDGKIVTTGFSANEIIITARFNTNGSPDATFNGTGIAANVGTNDGFPLGVVLQNDGKIAIALEYFDNTNWWFALIRYTSTGAADTTFGVNGLLLQNFPFNFGGVSANALAIQSDGKIVSSGVVVTTLGGNQFFYAVGRYLVANNSLIPTTINNSSTGLITINGPTTITGTAQNPSIVTVFFKNGSGTTSLGTVTQANDQWSLNTGSLPNGTYYISAVNNYKDGNVLLASPSIVLPTNCLGCAIGQKYCGVTSCSSTGCCPS